MSARFISRTMTIAITLTAVQFAGVALGDDPWLEKGVAAPQMDAKAATDADSGAAADDKPIPRSSTGRAEAERRSNPAAPKAADTVGTSWTRSTIALAIVLAVIGGLTIASRRWVTPRIAGRPGLIHVLGRTQLSSRQTLCLVRVGPQSVLIGVSGDRMAALSVIDDPAVTASLAGQALSASPASFGKSLSNEEAEFAQLAARGDAEDPVAAGESAGVTSDGQLARLRGRLAETIERLSRRKTA